VVHQLADGYRDAAEIESRPSSRYAIMAPFANRIDDARYTFDGQSHDSAAGRAGCRACRQARLRAWRGFRYRRTACRRAICAGNIYNFRDSARQFAGYPFAIDLAVTFTLDASGLSLLARMHNVGDKAAPCFFGWHPYFRVGDSSVDTWELEIPATSFVRMNADAIHWPVLRLISRSTTLRVRWISARQTHWRDKDR
jgi:aldose 1-epimerase